MRKMRLAEVIELTGRFLFLEPLLTWLPSPGAWFFPSPGGLQPRAWPFHPQLGTELWG